MMMVTGTVLTIISFGVIIQGNFNVSIDPSSEMQLFIWTQYFFILIGLVWINTVIVTAGTFEP